MTASALAKKVDKDGVGDFVGNFAEDSKKLASYLSHASASMAADVKDRLIAAAKAA